MAILQTVLGRIPKGGYKPIRLEHILLLLFGAFVIAFSDTLYAKVNSIGAIIILIMFLGSVVGIAPIPMPTFRKNLYLQILSVGLFSGVLDSYIVLDLCKKLRIVQPGQDREAIMNQIVNQDTVGLIAEFRALCTISALIGGLILWFGEVYAAGVFLNDQRTGLLSALYIIPPVLIFLSILGLYAQLRLPIEIVPNKSVQFRKRNLLEFALAIALLLKTHNPLLCLGILIVYAVLTRQDDHLLDVWKSHTEINVMLVLFIALVAGAWLVANIITPLGLGEGYWKPIIPAAIQGVLWGPLYEDSSVHFWVRILTLSTGVLILPISSLVGVMLFKSLKQWGIYTMHGAAAAVVWYVIFIGWIWLTLQSPVGYFLEQLAHAGGAH